MSLVARRSLLGATRTLDRRIPPRAFPVPLPRPHAPVRPVFVHPLFLPSRINLIREHPLLPPSLQAERTRSRRAKRYLHSRLRPVSRRRRDPDGPPLPIRIVTHARLDPRPTRWLLADVVRRARLQREEPGSDSGGARLRRRVCRPVAGTWTRTGLRQAESRDDSGRMGRRTHHGKEKAGVTVASAQKSVSPTGCKSSLTVLAKGWRLHRTRTSTRGHHYHRRETSDDP